MLKKCCVNEQSSCVVVKKSQKIFCLDILGFRRSWKKKGEKKDKEEEEEDMSQKKHFELSKEKSFIKSEINAMIEKKVGRLMIRNGRLKKVSKSLLHFL